MERVHWFPAVAFLDTFAPDEVSDPISSSNHRAQPLLHAHKHKQAARDFDGLDTRGSVHLWDYSFAEAFNSSLICPEHTLAMSYDEDYSFGALYHDGNDVPEDGADAEWGHIEACVLFFAQDDDPFAREDSTHYVSKSYARKLQENKAYIATFVARVLSRQQHTHLFLVVVSGASARIVRADREAFVATHPFSYKTTPAQSVLRDFFRRFTEMSEAKRGIDTTARLLRREVGSTGERIAFMRQMATRELEGAADHARKCFEDSLDEAWPWYSVIVEGLEFLIAKPSAYSDKPSRASRGYVALCYSRGPRHGTFVWLKDTWRRILDDEYEQEGAVLIDLNQHGVQNVPTLVCHGDVSDHRLNLRETLARLSKQKLKRARSRIERVHYRVVTQEVGLPLEEFENSRDLAVVFRDCLQGHRDAYERAGVLHRDINEGNLVLVPYDVRYEDDVGIAYRGMLIDWEYSERVSRRSAPGFVYRADRRGTWDFLSIGAVNHPETPVSPADDFEAFFHVFLSLCLSYVRHNCQDPARFDKEYFTTLTAHGRTLASALKERCVKQGHLFLYMESDVQLQFLKETRRAGRKHLGCRTVDKVVVSHPVNEILNAWLGLVRSRYAREKELNVQRAPVAPRPSIPAAKENDLPGAQSLPATHRGQGAPLSCLEFNLGVPFPDSSDSEDDKDVEDSPVSLYDAMIKILSGSIGRILWPVSDKTHDQVNSEPSDLDGLHEEERAEEVQCGEDRPHKKRRMI